MTWRDNPDWQMTGLFLVALALLGCVMKLLARFLPANKPTERSAISHVLVSPDSILRSRPASGTGPVMLRITIFGGALLLGYWLYWQLVHALHVHGFLLGYFAVPILYLMSEFLVAVVTLVLLPSGRLLPALHNRPWAARSTADFWGHRWNLWFNDWFRYVISSRLRRHPLITLLMIFALSGLMHEWALNLPLYYITGTVLFGSMMIYFMLQALGILLEHYFLKSHPRLKAISMWLVVFAPSPLVLNEALLRALHLWPDRIQNLASFE